MLDPQALVIGKKKYLTDPWKKVCCIVEVQER
jgi:hypothetical protein